MEKREGQLLSLSDPLYIIVCSGVFNRWNAHFSFDWTSARLQETSTVTDFRRVWYHQVNHHPVSRNYPNLPEKPFPISLTERTAKTHGPLMKRKQLFRNSLQSTSTEPICTPLISIFPWAAVYHEIVAVSPIVLSPSTFPVLSLTLHSKSSRICHNLR